jgi:plastocyanin
MRRNGAVLGLVLVSAVLVSCGGGGDSGTRTVLVDYKHDEFASTFLSYYPASVSVHPGDTVRFKQTWTGEPHSVTMGALVDDMFKFEDIFEKYDSEEDARAHGVSEETINQINATFTHIPAMGDDAGIYQPGARPCFIAKRSDVPEYSDAEDNVRRGPETACPTKGQPAFTGRQALYNSGYIPWQGSGANEFVVKIANDATPGTYKYFCNYHWTFMNGTVKVVPESKAIPSSGAVNREALKQIRADARKPLAATRKAVKKYSGPGTNALAGTADSDDEPRFVGANEFFPSKIHAKVGQPITWSFKGVLAHTISFNVPGYFPVFTIGKNGNVHWDKRAQDPVRWTVPEAESSGDHESKPRAVDVGKWDGTGGFHSSGLLSEGDTFTLTFTKPGTYPYACVVHPPMIGQVVVTA